VEEFEWQQLLRRQQQVHDTERMIGRLAAGVQLKAHLAVAAADVKVFRCSQVDVSCFFSSSVPASDVELCVYFVCARHLAVGKMDA